jgi:hypothetical protein
MPNEDSPIPLSSQKRDCYLDKEHCRSEPKTRAFLHMPRNPSLRPLSLSAQRRGGADRGVVARAFPPRGGYRGASYVCRPLPAEWCAAPERENFKTARWGKMRLSVRVETRSCASVRHADARSASAAHESSPSYRCSLPCGVQAPPRTTQATLWFRQRDREVGPHMHAGFHERTCCGGMARGLYRIWTD